MHKLEQIGKQIRNKRISLNLSMDQVAKEVNISRVTLSSIENGNGSVSIEHYLEVMKLLGIEFTINTDGPQARRKRATRRNTVYQKKINEFVIMCVELYAQHIDKPSNETYFLLLTNGLLDLLRDDYEDMHGFGFEYINDYIDKYLKARKAL